MKMTTSLLYWVLNLKDNLDENICWNVHAFLQNEL